LALDAIVADNTNEIRIAGITLIGLRLDFYELLAFVRCWGHLGGVRIDALELCGAIAGVADTGYFVALTIQRGVICAHARFFKCFAIVSAGAMTLRAFPKVAVEYCPGWRRRHSGEYQEGDSENAQAFHGIGSSIETCSSAARFLFPC
jgi:hypothetical protein